MIESCLCFFIIVMRVVLSVVTTYYHCTGMRFTIYNTVTSINQNTTEFEDRGFTNRERAWTIAIVDDIILARF
jgi:hypothetical protein